MRIRWHRLLTNPTTRLLSRDRETTRLEVRGLVCDTVCAARTREALAALPGVRDVRVDYDRGIATIEGTPHPPETYERAVTGVVAGRGLRGLLERISHNFTGARPA